MCGEKKKYENGEDVEGCKDMLKWITDNINCSNVNCKKNKLPRIERIEQKLVKRIYESGNLNCYIHHWILDFSFLLFVMFRECLNCIHKLSPQF